MPDTIPTFGPTDIIAWVEEESDTHSFVISHGSQDLRDFFFRLISIAGEMADEFIEANPNPSVAQAVMLIGELVKSGAIEPPDEKFGNIHLDTEQCFFLHALCVELVRRLS